MITAFAGNGLKLKHSCFGFNSFSIRFITATLLAVFCFPVYAGLKLEVEAAMEYDSNVATDAADTDAGLGDVARNTSLGLGYDFKINNHWNLSSVYRLNDTHWYTYDEFDSQMHIGLMRLGYQQENISSDISLIHAYGRVDGKDFLSLNRLSPALGYVINSNWYFRVQSDVSQKTFALYEQRNGDSLAASFYLYRFIDRTRFYITAQMQWKQEDTQDNVYTYQANTFKLQLKRDWQLLSYKGSTRLKGQYEKRQYEGIRTSINAAREDDRWSLALQSSVHLTKQWRINSRLQTDYFDSNVAAANYDQERIQLGLSWEF
jgi:hypothetical protein